MPSPRKATSRLVGLTIKEGSLVDNGDNPHAHVVFFKRAPEDEPMPQPATASTSKGYGYDQPRTLGQILGAQKFASAIQDLRWAFMDSVSSIMGSSDPTTIAPMMSKSVAEFGAEAEKLVAELKSRSGDTTDTAKGARVTEIVAQLKAQTITEKSIPPDGGAPASVLATLALLDDVVGKASPPATTEKSSMPENTKPTALADAIKALPADVAAAIETEKKAAIDKAVAEAVAEAMKAKQPEVEGVAKQLADIEKRAAAAESEVAKLRDEKLTESMVAKARDIGIGDVDETAQTLKSAFAISPEAGAQIEKTLRAAAEQAKHAQKVLTSTAGSAATFTKGSPEARAEELVDALVKAKPSLTREQAFVEVAREHPGLYSELAAQA
jgi:organic radical activating enzyme